MTCGECGGAVFFISEVQRFAPTFDRPDMALATCSFCSAPYLKARIQGDWVMHPLNSEEAMKLLHAESVRKVG